jgi:hypothetical protein
MPCIHRDRVPRTVRAAVSALARFKSRGLIYPVSAGLLAFVLVTHGSPRSLAQRSEIVPPETGSLGLAWGLVLSADRTTTLAEPELNRFSRILGVRPRLYLCNGWYRAVAAYRSEREAITDLQKVLRSGTRRSPYIVALQDWCPSKKLMSSS